MDAWTAAAGWIVAIMLGALWLARERVHRAELGMVIRQLAQTERELWGALQRAAHLESVARDVRLGDRRPVTTIDRDYCE